MPHQITWYVSSYEKYPESTRYIHRTIYTMHASYIRASFGPFFPDIIQS